MSNPLHGKYNPIDTSKGMMCNCGNAATLELYDSSEWYCPHCSYEADIDELMCMIHGHMTPAETAAIENRIKELNILIGD